MTFNMDLIFFITLLLSFLENGLSIKCLQCTSLLTPACTKGTLEAKQCSADSHYCIKYVGQLKKDQVVFRDCNTDMIEHNCTLKVMSDLPIHVCYETCDTDSCNDGPAVAYNPYISHGNKPLFMWRYCVLALALTLTVLIR